MTKWQAVSSPSHQKRRESWPQRARTCFRYAYLLAVLLLLVYPFTRSAFRDNDQGAFLRGGWELAHDKASFWHGLAYNYDKQWGTYLLLDVVYRCLPRLDPVFAGNLAQVVLISCAWLSLGVRTGRNRSAPFVLLLPVVASPALILYAPYLGTAWLSLAFLLIAFFLVGSRASKWSLAGALVSLAAAAACRADVLLATPALLLTQSSRSSLAGLIKRRTTWFFAAAAVLPIAFGKWIDANPAPNTNPLGFELKPYLALLLFGLTPACLLLMAWVEAVHLRMAFKKPRFLTYYGLTALALVAPIAFYSLQLYTIRYFFLTVACLLFSASSRRAAALYRAQRTLWRPGSIYGVTGLVLLTLAPWLVGIKMATLWRVQLTISQPTRLPTGDGHYPLGAYLAFEKQVLFDDHFQIDHNQKIWLTARSVAYKACSDGTVPLLWSPMVNYLAFAAALEGEEPRTLRTVDDHCDAVYADLRSLSRSVDNDDAQAERIFGRDVRVVSNRFDLGQPILVITSNGKTSSEGRTFLALRSVFKGRETEMHLNDKAGAALTADLNSEVDTVDFSLNGECQAKVPPGWSRLPVLSPPLTLDIWKGPAVHFPTLTSLTCTGQVTGWAKSVVPTFMRVSHDFAVQAYGHPIKK